MKKIFTYSIIALSSLFVFATIFGVSAVAAKAVTGHSVFDRVVDKLHLNVSSVELKNAFDDSKVEIKTENVTSKLSDAVKAGKLTQAQADLAAKIPSVMESIRNTETKPDMSTFKNMTPEERKAKLDQIQTDNQAALAKGLGISVDELKTLQTALKDAGIGQFGGMMGGGRGGMMRGGRGMMGGQSL